MSMRVDSNQLIAGRCVVTQYPGHGIQAQNIPATGESGPAALYNDAVALGALPTDEMRWQILTVPASGTFTPYESSEFTLVGASDGVHYSTYLGFINGAPYLNPETDDGEWIITMTIGDPTPPEEVDITINAGVPTLGASASIALSSSLVVAAGVPTIDASASISLASVFTVSAGIPTMSAASVMTESNSILLLAGISSPTASCIMAGDSLGVISYAVDAIALLPFKNRFAEV